MISNDTTTTTNNNKIEIKCLDHPNQDIIFLCLTCEKINNFEIPACVECVCKNHQQHRFDIIENKSQDELLEKFENGIKPELQNQLKDNESLLSKSKKSFEETEKTHNSNLTTIKTQFEELHNRLKIVELDLINQLKFNLSKNEKFYNEKKSILEDLNKAINNLIDKINNDNDIQLKEIVNYSYKNKIERNEIDYSNCEILIDQMKKNIYNDLIKSIF